MISFIGKQIIRTKTCHCDKRFTAKWEICNYFYLYNTKMEYFVILYTLIRGVGTFYSCTFWHIFGVVSSNCYTLYQWKICICVPTLYTEYFIHEWFKRNRNLSLGIQGVPKVDVNTQRVDRPADDWPEYQHSISVVKNHYFTRH